MKIKIYNFNTKEELQEFDLAFAMRSSGKCTVGRSPTSSLVLESADVSRNHGEFKYQAGDYYFYDTGSSNGSLVNNQVVAKNQAYRLEAGHTLQLGEFLLIPQPLAQVAEAMTVLSPIAIPLPDLETINTSEQLVPSEDNAELAVAAESSDSIAADLPLSEKELQHDRTLAVSEPEPESTDAPEAEVVAEPVVSQTSTEEVVPETKLEDALVESVPSNSLADATPIDLINESPLEIEEPQLDIMLDLVPPEEQTVIQSDAETARSSDLEETDPWEQPVPESSSTEAIDHQVLLEDPEAAPTTSILDEAPVQPDLEDAIRVDRTVEGTTAEYHSADELMSASVVVPENSTAVIDEEDTMGDKETTQTSEAPTIAEKVIEDVAEPTVLQAIPAQDVSIRAEHTVEETTTEPHFVGESITTPAVAQEISTAVIGEENETNSKETVPTSETLEIVENESEDAAEPTVLQSIPAQGGATVTQAHTAQELIVLEEADTSVQVKPSDYLPEEFSQIESAQNAADTDAETESDNDRIPAAAIPEILQQKYIALLAHESQKAALVDFIDRHQVTFSNCLLMATPSIGEALLKQTGITLSRSLPNLSASGYQQVSAAVTCGELLAVVFLRDFIVPQPTQANDEALSRACNVSSVIFAANVATAEAMESYLQLLLTPEGR